MRCRALTTAYYVQAGIRAEDDRIAYLKRVAVGISYAQPEDWSEEVADDADVDVAESHSRELIVALTDGRTLRAQVRSSLHRTVEAIADTAIADVNGRLGWRRFIGWDLRRGSKDRRRDEASQEADRAV